jgi:putative tricarboxylic transport membrane protein
LRVIANAQMWGALFWLAIALFVTWSGHDLGLGRLSEPGSGFALFWIGIIMSALAISTLVSSLKGPADSVASLWRGTRWAKVLLVVVLLLVFGFFFEALGFVVCSLALLLILMVFVDPVRPVTAISVSLVATFGVWYVLTKLLKIQLPSGILAPLLG